MKQIESLNTEPHIRSIHFLQKCKGDSIGKNKKDFFSANGAGTNE